MSETIPQPNTGPFAEQSRVLVNSQEMLSVENRQEPVSHFSPAIASASLHERGGRVISTMRKGDVFTHPNTGERQVIEGVRGRGENQIIAYTRELAPGVRMEPGRVIRQLPRINFEVQRDINGLTEKTPAFVREFEEVDAACQEVFTVVNKAYALQKEQGNITQEADELMDCLEPLSEKMGEVVDAWNVLLAENNSDDEKPLLAQFEKLRQLVAEIPAELVKPFPLLVQIQREIQSRVKNEEDSFDDEEKQAGRKKTPLKTRKPRVLDEHGRQYQVSRRGRGSKQAGDIADNTHLESQQTIDQKYSKRQERIIPEVIDPEFLHGTVEERFVKYGLSQKEWSEDWGDDEQHTIDEWIAAIRFAQQDLTDLANEMRRVRRIRRWEQVMDSLSPQYRTFAQSENGDVVAKRLSEIEGRLTSLALGSTEWSNYVAQHRSELRTILFQYLDILRAGVYVLAQARQHTSDLAVGEWPNQEGRENDQKAKQNERTRERSSRRGDSPFSEAVSRTSAERVTEDGIEAEEENAELSEWIGGIRQQLQDLDQLASKIFKKKRTTEFKEALFAVSTDHEAFARAKKVKEITGELDDIESALFSRRQWSSQEEYDEWFASKVTRLQEYARIYGEILRTGERVLGAKLGRDSAQREKGHRIDEDTVIEMPSIERALQTVGPTYVSLEPEVQQELLKGLERIADTTRAIVERANVVLLANGITDPDIRREMIVRQFGSKVEEGMQKIVTHAGFTPREVTRLTRTLLITGPNKDSDTQA
jgi:hypothetical protein